MAGVQLQFQPDLARAELLLAIGVNTVVSHGHGVMVPNPLGHLRDLRARGGRLVVIDPRRSESARHADLHLAPRPGTDRVRRRPPRPRGAAAGRRRRRSSDACADAPSLRAARRRRRAVRRGDRPRRSPACPSADLEALDALVAGAGRIAHRDRHRRDR